MSRHTRMAAYLLNMNQALTKRGYGKIIFECDVVHAGQRLFISACNTRQEDKVDSHSGVVRKYPAANPDPG